MTPIKKVKDEIRREYAAKRDALSMDVRAQRSAKICNTAMNLISFRHAEIVLLYAPIKSEIDVIPLALAALEKGKAVAFPRCNKEDRTMKFHFVTSLDELEVGAYNIMEPKEDAPVYDPLTDTRVAICYVPGLTFDVYGYRLGYGKGYYDKFMNQFGGCTIGLTYSDLIVKELPKGRYDRHCDILLTENGAKAIKIEKIGRELNKNRF